MERKSGLPRVFYPRSIMNSHQVRVNQFIFRGFFLPRYVCTESKIFILLRRLVVIVLFACFSSLLSSFPVCVFTYYVYKLTTALFCCVLCILHHWFSGNLQKCSRAYWLIFIVNKRTDTWIYNLMPCSNNRERTIWQLVFRKKKRKQIDVSVSCVRPVINNEFRQNVVKSSCGSMMR